MIWNVAYVVGSAVGSAGAARPGAESIVSQPRLVGRLGASARVTVVSAPPGSGKTVLLWSCISQAGAANCAACVPVGRAEHDPQQFWLSDLAALRQTDPGAAKPVMAIFGVPGEGEKDDRRIDMVLSGFGS
jgi:LuxR family maltose regulon positive regulatory protein